MLEESEGSRRTRPSNRKELISAAASRLFYEGGFDRVSMGDIADSVEVGASALYRHFKNKQEILRQIIQDGIEPLTELIDSVDKGGSDTFAIELASVALENRSMGMLLQREIRHLGEQDATSIRQTLRGLQRRVSEQLIRMRPQLSENAASLLADAVLSVLASLSFHRIQLARPAFDHLIADLVQTVVDTDLPDIPTSDLPTFTPIASASRREALLDHAVVLFARHGYNNVGVEDIGSAVGIAGPSVYNHFSSKNDILVTVLRRGSAVLFMDLAFILRTSSDVGDALRRLIQSYVEFAVHHSAIVSVMGTEVEHLDEDDQSGLRRIQHEYVDEWVQLLRAARPDLSTDLARIRVQAVLTVVNNNARTARFRAVPALASSVEIVCQRLLASP